MKNFTKYSIIIFLLLISKISYGSTIIYDAQTQNVLREIANPIFRVAGLKNPRIFIIYDDSPNAFTAGGEDIYIHSGLLARFKDPEIIRGVIAHETGHITSKHVVKSQARIEREKKLETMSLILGLVGAVASDNPMAGVQGAIIGSHMAQRNMLKFSRENESEADIKASDYLMKAGFSSRGLIDLLQYFHSKNSISREFAYDLTHPVSLDRINLLKSRNSAQANSVVSKSLLSRYELVSAKMRAYTSNTLNFNDYSQKAKNFAQSILFARQSKRNDSIRIIDNLIRDEPQNPYFYQLKAEILTNFGDKSAIASYQKAYNLSKDELIKVEMLLAILKLSENKDEIKKSIAFLELSMNNFGYNRVICEFLSIGHSKVGNIAASLYYRALIASRSGDFKSAKRFIAKAKNSYGISNQMRLKIEDLETSLK